MIRLVLFSLAALAVFVAATCTDSTFISGYKDGCEGVALNFEERMASGIVDRIDYRIGVDERCADTASTFVERDDTYIAGFKEGCRSGVHLLAVNPSMDNPLSAEEVEQGWAICDKNKEGEDVTHLPKPAD